MQSLQLFQTRHVQTTDYTSRTGIIKILQY